MDSTNIIPITIEDEMRGSYMDYAMSVIIGRALPDARDGLKPVHRRILYAMFSEGLLSNRRYSKCAGVVGEVLKKYHPHGDSAVYDALVRMAQPWNLRYPLINGQGNFGSVDGDSAAAYRYTECRMESLAEMILADIEKDTVDFSPNFDESTDEPIVLPTRIPNLLINGAEGIAVGMASKIPPHNLREVVAATIHMITNPDCTIDALMEFVPGPDFPTGGIIYGSAPLREVYHTGRGLFQIRSKVRIETLKGPKREVEAIIVDEIPFQVNKAKLVEKIAELVNEKKIEGISKLRDESDRRGMRIVIELKRDAVSDVVLNQLYKHTPLQKSFGVIMLSIVDSRSRPRIMNLKETLQEFISHRRTTVARRTRFELNKAQSRLHILEGLRIALQNIDAIIALIKASESTEIAKAALRGTFALSDIQAQQILDMPLRRLTGLEQQSIEEEYTEILGRIEFYTKLLSNRSEVDRVIVEELQEVSEKFGDARRTVIEQDGEDIDLEDLIAEEEMVVSISHRGYAKRLSPENFRAQRRGGKGVMGTKKLAEEDEDFVSDMFVASTHAYLLVFTNLGRLHWLKVYQLPEAARTARGRAIVNILQLGDEERVSAIVPVRRFEEGKHLLLVTKRGVVKRLDLMDVSNVRRGGIKATELDEGDQLVAVRLTDGLNDCILCTKTGMSIRFFEDDVRVMGRAARGVRGVMLSEGDEVVGVTIVPHVSASPEVEVVEHVQVEEVGDAVVESVVDSVVDSVGSNEITLLTVCENGYGKRTLVSSYRTQSRGGKGIIDIKTTERNGMVVASSPVTGNDHVMLITTAGKVIRLSASNISCIGRNTMGVGLINLEEGERVVAVARLAEAVGDEIEEVLPVGEEAEPEPEPEAEAGAEPGAEPEA